MDLITRYFPALDERQREQFSLMERLYPEWNAKINVVSRRDIDNLECHHILHSLAIARFMTPVAGSTILDLGCGGGFPGIPLAVLWPDVTFHLIDRIGKKITVATDIANNLGLENVTFQHGDVGECHERFDYVVSRAVMPLDSLVRASARSLARPRKGNSFPPGLVCLKGGDLSAETQAVKRPMIRVPLTDWFAEPYFEGKELVYVEM